MAPASKYFEGLIPHERSARDGTIEEERRLFYVALTRAQRHITLFECLSRSRHGREKMCETSRFLREIPENLIKNAYTPRHHLQHRLEHVPVHPLLNLLQIPVTLALSHRLFSFDLGFLQIHQDRSKRWPF